MKYSHTRIFTNNFVTCNGHYMYNSQITTKHVRLNCPDCIDFHSNLQTQKTGETKLRSYKIHKRFPSTFSQLAFLLPSYSQFYNQRSFSARSKILVYVTQHVRM